MNPFDNLLFMGTFPPYPTTVHTVQNKNFLYPTQTLCHSLLFWQNRLMLIIYFFSFVSNFPNIQYCSSYLACFQFTASFHPTISSIVIFFYCLFLKYPMSFTVLLSPIYILLASFHAFSLFLILHNFLYLIFISFFQVFCKSSKS